MELAPLYRACCCLTTPADAASLLVLLDGAPHDVLRKCGSLVSFSFLFSLVRSPETAPTAIRLIALFASAGVKGTYMIRIIASDVQLLIDLVAGKRTTEASPEELVTVLTFALGRGHLSPEIAALMASPEVWRRLMSTLFRNTPGLGKLLYVITQGGGYSKLKQHGESFTLCARSHIRDATMATPDLACWWAAMGTYGRKYWEGGDLELVTHTLDIVPRDNELFTQVALEMLTAIKEWPDTIELLDIIKTLLIDVDEKCALLTDQVILGMDPCVLSEFFEKLRGEGALRDLYMTLIEQGNSYTMQVVIHALKLLAAMTELAKCWDPEAVRLCQRAAIAPEARSEAQTLITILDSLLVTTGEGSIDELLSDDEYALYDDDFRFITSASRPE